MPKKTLDFDKMARTFAATGKMGAAMVAGGYSIRSSQRGKASMSHTSRDKFKQALDQHIGKTLSKFEAIGKGISAEQQENLVRGALLANVAQGKDKATASLKMLGADRRVNMFTPESTSGVILIQAVPIPPFENRE